MTIWVALVAFVTVYGEPAVFRWPGEPAETEAACIADQLEQAIDAVADAGLVMLHADCVSEKVAAS